MKHPVPPTLIRILTGCFLFILCLLPYGAQAQALCGRVTVGPGRQFEFLDEAIRRLNQDGDTCAVTLVLASGTHALSENLNRTLHYPLTITSEVRDSALCTIKVEDYTAKTFSGANAYIIQHITLKNGPNDYLGNNYGLFLTGAKGVILDSCAISGFYYNGSGNAKLQSTTFHWPTRFASGAQALDTVQMDNCAYRPFNFDGMDTYGVLYNRVESSLHVDGAKYVRVRDLRIATPFLTNVQAPQGVAFTNIESMYVTRAKTVSTIPALHLAHIDKLRLDSSTFISTYPDAISSDGVNPQDMPYAGILEFIFINEGRILKNTFQHTGGKGFWAISHAGRFRGDIATPPSTYIVSTDYNLILADNTIRGYHFGINLRYGQGDPYNPRTYCTTTLEHNDIQTTQTGIYIPDITGVWAQNHQTYLRILRNRIRSGATALQVEGYSGLIASNFMEGRPGLWDDRCEIKLFGNTILSSESAIRYTALSYATSISACNILQGTDRIVQMYLYQMGPQNYKLNSRNNAYYSTSTTPFWYSSYQRTTQELDFERLKMINPSDTSSLWEIPGFTLPHDPSVANARLAYAPGDSLPYDLDIDGNSRSPQNFYGCKKPLTCPQNLALIKVLAHDSSSYRRYQIVVTNAGTSPSRRTTLAGQLNERPPAYMQVPPLSPGQNDTVTLAAIPIDSFSVFRFRAYLPREGNLQDCSKMDDTVRHVTYPYRYCGSYSVGGTQADFTTLLSALYRLNIYGIGCPVELRLRPGVHPCMIGFDSLPGVNDNTPLVILSESNDSTSVTIAPGARPTRDRSQWGAALEPTLLPGRIIFKKVCFGDLTLISHIRSGSFQQCSFSGNLVTRYLGNVNFRRCTFHQSVLIEDSTGGRPFNYNSDTDTLTFSKCTFLKGITIKPTLGQRGYGTVNSMRAPALFDSCYVTNSESSSLIKGIWSYDYYRPTYWVYNYLPHRPFYIINSILEVKTITSSPVIESLDIITISKSRINIEKKDSSRSASFIRCGHIASFYGEVAYEGFCKVENSTFLSNDTTGVLFDTRGLLNLSKTTVRGFKSTAICEEADYHPSLIASDNIIQNYGTSFSTVGSVSFYRNLVRSACALSQSYRYYPGACRVSIFNNIIQGKKSCLDMEMGDIYNNTLTSTSGCPFISRVHGFSGSSPQITFRNNILYTADTNTLLTIEYPRGFSSSHNILHTTGPILARIGDTVYHSLDTLQAHGYEQGSLAVDPYLSGDSIPIPLNPAVANQGTYIPGLRTDYFGHLRDTLSPDPGAVEMGPPPRLVRLLAPIHTCHLTPAERVQVRLEGAYPGMILAYRLDTSAIIRDTIARATAIHTFRQPADLSAGSHSLRIWIQGRSDTLTATFTPQPVPQPRLTASPGCLSDTVPFRVEPAGGTFPGPVWLYFGDGDSVRGTTASHLYTRAAAYRAYTRAYAADSACFTIDSLLVQPHPLPQAAFAIRSACLGQPLQILAPTADPSQAPYQYLWHWGDGRQDTAAQPAPTYAQPGPYQIRLQVTSIHGCHDSASAWVDLQPAPQVTVSPTGTLTLQAGVPLPLHARYSGGSIRWSNGSTDSLLNVTQPGSYFATVRGTGGCIAQSDTIRVRLLEPLTLSLGPDRLGCSGDTIRLSGPSGMTFYSWSPGDTTQTLSVTRSGVYRLTVSDSAGRRATAQVEVILKPRQSVTYQIPAEPHCGADSAFRIRASVSFFRFEGSGISPDGIIRPMQADSVIRFRLIATDTGYCSDTATGAVRIHANPQPPVFDSVSYRLCIRDTLWLRPRTLSGRLVWAEGGSYPLPRPLHRPGTYQAWFVSDSGCSSSLSMPVRIDSAGLLPLPGILRHGDTLRAVDNAPRTYHNWDRYLPGSSSPDYTFMGYFNPPYVLADLPGTYVLMSYDVGGSCQRTDTLIISIPVAAKDTRGTAISIFPSPVDDVLTLQAPANSRIFGLSDLLGRMLPLESPDPHQLSVKPLPAGTYLLHVKDRDGTVRHLPFIKR